MKFIKVEDKLLPSPLYLEKRAFVKYRHLAVLTCLGIVIFYIIFNACAQDKFSIRGIAIYHFWDRRAGTVPTTPEKQIAGERKLILVWTTHYGESNWLPTPESLHCSITHCDVTSDRSLLNSSSALVLYWRDIRLSDLPRCRSTPCPLWVLFNRESPPHTPRNVLVALNNRIHWTVTYRRDSDIFAPYGKVVKNNGNYTMPEFSTNRSLVCWLVSNCNTASGRELYVHELRKYIPVKIYGKCGTLKCPFSGHLECYQWLAERCMFYLSFENSICRDYATEKLYHALHTDMVPVVLGGEDYAQYMPDHSYIDARAFPMPSLLAQNLYKLAANKEAYLEYFRWKRDYMAMEWKFQWVCDLCEKLYKYEAGTVVPHARLSSWWYDKAKCKSWGLRL